MPAYNEDYQAIKEAQARAKAATSSAGQLTAGAGSFSSNVMDRVTAARAARGVDQLSIDLGNEIGALSSSGAEIRNRLMEVNPLNVDKMLAADRGRIEGNIETLTNFQSGITGKVEDILKMGTDRLTAAAAIKKAEADQANEEVNQLLDIIARKQEQEKIAMSSAGGGLTPYEQVKLAMQLAQEQTKVAAKNQSLNIINSTLSKIEEDLKKIPTGRVGGAYSAILGKFGFSPVQTSLRQNIALSVPILSKEILNLGVLSNQDLSFVLPTLPNENDTPAEAKKKIENLRALLEGATITSNPTIDFLQGYMGGGSTGGGWIDEGVVQ